MPRNLVRRRRRKIRRIPVQRRRYRSWASPGPAKRRRYLAAAVKLGDGLSAVGPRASWCGYGDALWKKHRAGRARVPRFGNTRVCLLGEYEFIERPPGVPFQKIQFGNERGGRSVLSRLPELRIARILALLRCLILCPSSEGNFLLGGGKLLVFYQLLLYYIPPDRSIYLAFKLESGPDPFP